MLPMAEQLQLRAQKPDNGVALADFGFLLVKFRRLFSDERAQNSGIDMVEEGDDRLDEEFSFSCWLLLLPQ